MGRFWSLARCWALSVRLNSRLLSHTPGLVCFHALGVVCEGGCGGVCSSSAAGAVDVSVDLFWSRGLRTAEKLVYLRAH